RFVSLQKGSVAADARDERLLDLGGKLSDFGDTARVIRDLDLVVTVDTAVAHLAGALGKAVHLLLPFNADWRWLTGRESSPWYPTMRLFRQHSPGGWDAVIDRVMESLCDLQPSPPVTA